MSHQITNLEQVRAKNALKFTHEHPELNTQVAGYHSLIINNGLLSTFAFSLQKKADLELVAEAITEHLRNMISEQRIPASFTFTSTKGLIEELSKGSSLELRIITNESMAFLSYLKRFNSLLPKHDL